MQKAQDGSRYGIRETVKELSKNFLEDILFDRIFFRDAITENSDIDSLCKAVKDIFSGGKEKEILDKDAILIFSQRIPRLGQRLSRVLKSQVYTSPFASIEEQRDIFPLLDKMAEAEKEFFEDKTNNLVNWTEDTIKESFTKYGFAIDMQNTVCKENRRLTENEIDRWFNDKVPYGKKIGDALGEDRTKKIAADLKKVASKKIFSWQYENAFFSVKKI